MKKLIIAVAVAMVAMMSQAYSVQWSARNIYIPVAADAKVSQSGIIASSGEKFAAGALVVQLYWVGNSGNNLIGEYSTTGDGVISTLNLGDSSSAIYNAMITDSGTTYVPTYYFTATYTTSDGTYVYAGTASATKALANIGASNIASAGNFATAGSWDYTAAPEPTSGLLLLLGIAGMALKRKRA